MLKVNCYSVVINGFIVAKSYLLIKFKGVVLMKYLSAVVLLLLSTSVWAQDPNRPPTIPEPETLLLIGIGVVALVASRIKRK